MMRFITLLYNYTLERPASTSSSSSPPPPLLAEADTAVLKQHSSMER